MDDPRHVLGAQGERTAKRYLLRHGYRLLAQNWRCGKYEIDLVMRHHDTLVFVEVKTRTQAHTSPSPFGSPAASVTKAKQHALLLAAQQYLRRYQITDTIIRFDVIEVYASLYTRYFFHREIPYLKVEHINHIENAFVQSHGQER